MADFNAVASDFVKFYYHTFDTNRPGLLPLYRPTSMLTFEGQQFQGAQAITEKLVGLPFQKVAHNISTIDAQPSSSEGSILVNVSGQLLIDEEKNPQFFCQSFLLMAENGSYYVFNDMFRLIYGA